jgi:hypothetical protein
MRLHVQVLEVISSIDNREIAVSFWIVIMLAWCISKDAVRKSFVDVLKLITARPISLMFALAATYLAVVTYALKAVDFWTLQQFKITVLWFLFAGIPSLADISKISDDSSRLRTSVSSNFKLSLLLDFFVNLFKMPLAAEFFFVPLTAFIGGMLAVAQGNEKYNSVSKFLNFLQVLIGSALLAFAFYKIASDFNSVANLNTSRDFALPILYNLAFVPVLWILALYTAYESVFARIMFVVADDGLRTYTTRRLIFLLRTDIRALNRWFRSAWTTSLASRNEIELSILAIKRRP